MLPKVSIGQVIPVPVDIRTHSVRTFVDRVQTNRFVQQCQNGHHHRLLSEVHLEHSSISDNKIFDKFKASF